MLGSLVLTAGFVNTPFPAKRLLDVEQKLQLQNASMAILSNAIAPLIGLNDRVAALEAEVATLKTDSNLLLTTAGFVPPPVSPSPAPPSPPSPLCATTPTYCHASETGAKVALDAAIAGATSTDWPALYADGSLVSFKLATGTAGMAFAGTSNSVTHVAETATAPAHYLFAADAGHPYFQDTLASGFGGTDFAISVCITYQDTLPTPYMVRAADGSVTPIPLAPSSVALPVSPWAAYPSSHLHARHPRPRIRQMASRVGYSQTGV